MKIRPYRVQDLFDLTKPHQRRLFEALQESEKQ